MIPTIGVAAGTVIAIDPLALVSGFGADPEISANRDAVVHYEDTTPLQIGSGTPTTVAAPTWSTWQSDSVVADELEAYCETVGTAIGELLEQLRTEIDEKPDKLGEQIERMRAEADGRLVDIKTIG